MKASWSAKPQLGGNNRQVVERVGAELVLGAPRGGIAAILSDMDAEIAALETKLVKARSLKQGMMHELLTGRIRLL